MNLVKLLPVPIVARPHRRITMDVFKSAKRVGASHVVCVKETKPGVIAGLGRDRMR